jgi:VWFA-related protein
VVDQSGKLLTELPRSAFKVFENGAEQEIKTFKREDVPVSMGILIDGSGSMRDKKGKVAAAAVGFVKASNPQDEMFIVNFNDEAYLDVPLTNDRKQLEQGLTKIDSRGGTAMRDAINMGMDYLRQKATKDKKVLVVITDGNDTASNQTFEALLAKARQSEILIYAIAILAQEEPREAKKAQRAVKELTEASGGIAYYPKELEEVSGLAMRVAEEIRNQYVIAYTPKIQELDGSYRQIKVSASGRGRPIVRTRAGYFASPDNRQKR